MKNNQLKKRIKNLLAEDIKYQISDEVLMARIWYDDILKLNYGNMEGLKAYHILHMLREGKLTSYKSASRKRREIQHQYPQLRDEETWNKRHAIAEKIRANLITNN